MVKWGRDKWKHFWVGIPLGMLILWAAIRFLPNEIPGAVFLAITVLVFICYMFEVISLITDLGFYELMDAFAGIAGGVVGMSVISIYYFIA